MNASGPIVPVIVCRAAASRRSDHGAAPTPDLLDALPECPAAKPRHLRGEPAASPGGIRRGPGLGGRAGAVVSQRSGTVRDLGGACEHRATRDAPRPGGLPPAL